MWFLAKKISSKQPTPGAGRSADGYQLQLACRHRWQGSSTSRERAGGRTVLGGQQRRQAGLGGARPALRRGPRPLRLRQLEAEVQHRGARKRELGAHVGGLALRSVAAGARLRQLAALVRRRAVKDGHELEQAADVALRRGARGLGGGAAGLGSGAGGLRRAARAASASASRPSSSIGMSRPSAITPSASL